MNSLPISSYLMHYSSKGLSVHEFSDGKNSLVEKRVVLKRELVLVERHLSFASEGIANSR